MIKIIHKWFKCQYPSCKVESDTGYEIEYKGKKIVICAECLKKIKKSEKKKQL